MEVPLGCWLRAPVRLDEPGKGCLAAATSGDILKREAVGVALACGRLASPSTSAAGLS